MEFKTSLYEVLIKTYDERGRLCANPAIRVKNQYAHDPLLASSIFIAVARRRANMPYLRTATAFHRSNGIIGRDSFAKPGQSKAARASRATCSRALRSLLSLA